MTNKIIWHPHGTPGPWAYETGPSMSGRHHAVYPDGDEGPMICECYQGSESEQESNARVIAEVPAMVQALRALTSTFDGGGRTGDASKVISDMRAILARIDGEA